MVPPAVFSVAAVVPEPEVPAVEPEADEPVGSVGSGAEVPCMVQ